ncbi:hypothetical protein ACU4GD_33570 [Cupriavidus basilensis]
MLAHSGSAYRGLEIPGGGAGAGCRGARCRRAAPLPARAHAWPLVARSAAGPGAGAQPCGPAAGSAAGHPRAGLVAGAPSARRPRQRRWGLAQTLLTISDELSARWLDDDAIRDEDIDGDDRAALLQSAGTNLRTFVVALPWRGRRAS